MLISKSYVLDSELHLIMLSQLVFLYNKTEFYLYALAFMQSNRSSLQVSCRVHGLRVLLFLVHCVVYMFKYTTASVINVQDQIE